MINDNETKKKIYVHYICDVIGDTQNNIITYIITNESEIYTIYHVRHHDFYTAHYR